MLKDLFLTPGRWLTRILAREKKRTYRSARSRPTESLGTVLLSLVCWLALAGCVLYSIDKAGFLKQALDVGVEAATSGDVEVAGPPASPADPGTSTGSATGSLVPASLTSPNSTKSPETSPGTSSQPAVETEMWLVILHSIPKSDAGRQEAERRQSQYLSRGLRVEVMDTDAFPLLQGRKDESWWIVALGPFETKAEALSASEKAKSFNSGLRVRRGL